MSKKKLAGEIRDFTKAHQEGWGHDQWMGFLQDLSEKGHDVSDPDGLGLALENERLTQTLRRIDLKGLGPKRIQAVADHYGTLWNLMSVSSENLADDTGIPRTLAEKILDVLQ